MHRLCIRGTIWHIKHTSDQGSAFQEYLNHDRKMLTESAEILEAAIDDIAEVSADFVIICGDLTKDGELESHRRFASLLERVAQQGKAIFVVPGNHDINNGEAYRYQGDSRERVATIDEQMFMDIYANYGFASSLHHDPDSLSYIAEPVEGLWLFAAYGMRFVLTGHFHAQDITIARWASDIPEHFLFDIETGSLVTYPVPWRLATIENSSWT